MKTKKLIAVALLAAIGTTAQAQIVSSQSQQVIVTQEVKPKKPKKPHYVKAYIKAGVGVDMYERHGSNSEFGYELDFGVKGNIGQQGAYWGAELGAMSAIHTHSNWDYSSDHSYYENESNFSIQLNPLVGWDFSVGGTTTFSPFIGPWVSYGFHEEEVRAGVSGGFNFWFDRKYAIGINYKRDVTDDNYFHKIVVGGIITF